MLNPYILGDVSNRTHVFITFRGIPPSAHLLFSSEGEHHLFFLEELSTPYT